MRIFATAGPPHGGRVDVAETEAVAPGLLLERGLLTAVAVDVVDLDVSLVMRHPVNGVTVEYRDTKKAIRAALAPGATPMAGKATPARAPAAQWLAVLADTHQPGRCDSGGRTAGARYGSRQRPSFQTARAAVWPRSTCRCRSG